MNTVGILKCPESYGALLDGWMGRGRDTPPILRECERIVEKLPSWRHAVRDEALCINGEMSNRLVDTVLLALHETGQGSN